MDKYDEAIKYLTEHPDEIYEAWVNNRLHRAGCLFQFCGDGLQPGVGCPTMVRGGRYHAATPELTAAIRADDRLPDFSDVITPATLPVFAEWQRRLDKELQRA